MRNRHSSNEFANFQHPKHNTYPGILSTDYLVFLQQIVFWFLNSLSHNNMNPYKIDGKAHQITSPELSTPSKMDLYTPPPQQSSVLTKRLRSSIIKTIDIRRNTLLPLTPSRPTPVFFQKCRGKVRYHLEALIIIIYVDRSRRCHTL